MEEDKQEEVLEPSGADNLEPTADEGATVPAEDNSEGSEPSASVSAGNFWDSFEDESLKENGSVRKFKSVEALAKSYVGLQKKLGERATHKLPDNATPEQVKAWREIKRGGVEAPEGYGFEAPEDLKDFDTGRIGKALFDAGADKDLFNSVMGDVCKAEAERRFAERKVREDGEAELRDEWNEDYEVNMKAVKMFVKSRFPEVYEGLSNTDAFRIPVVARMFKTLNELTADGEIRMKKASEASYEERLRSIETSAAFNNEWDPGYKAARLAWRNLIAEKAAKKR